MPLQSAHTRDPARRRARRRDHLGDEHRRRVVDGRELELLLRPEVGEEAALAHPGRFREPPDRERVEPLLGRERRRGVQDGLSGAFALRFQHGRLSIAADS